VSTAYKVLSDTLLSKLTSYAEEIIGDHQRGFRRNRSTADNMLCIGQILERKWRYNVAVHQLFIAFKHTLTQIEGRSCITEFGIPMKLVWLIKMCLNENNRVRVDKNLSDMFPIKNGYKQGDAVSPVLVKFAPEYAIRRDQEDQDCVKLNSTHQLLVYADDINILDRSVHTINKTQKL
jgi:hypothetical protein